MDFTLTDDQQAVAAAIEQIAEDFGSTPTEAHGFALVSNALDEALTEAGFFDIAAVPELGPVTAAVAVEQLARLPWTTEIALSMLVGPQLDGDWARPFAVIENGRPSRFAASAKTWIVIDGDQVSIGPASDEVEPVESLFAYPMARLTQAPGFAALPDDQARTIRRLLRVALAAEVAGLMQGAIDSTVEHLSVRKQFGRPLGSFQALRHRMAECAVLAGGVRHLALKAAWSGDDGDAALAALHAQDSATRLIYDVHQMLGAMGMTLEHPLHLWTYRMKALLSELGGRGGQAVDVARHCFAA